MKKVNCSLWMVVTDDGELVAGAVNGPMVSDSKRDANALLKTIVDADECRVARVKCVEVVPKKK